MTIKGLIKTMGEIMESTIYINGSDIDTVELLEYWRMSRAFKGSRYDRMAWTAERYSNLKFNVPSVRAYKALDIILQN